MQGRCSPFLLRNVLIPSRLQIEGEAVKAFYRNGLMCALTRAREMSFTFTPRRVYRPLRSESAAPTVKCHVVCARVRRLHCATSFVRRRRQLGRKRSPCPRTDAFCRCRKSRVLARPPIAFSARDASLLSERRQRRTKVAVPPGHGRAAMGEGSVLCTSGR